MDNVNIWLATTNGVYSSGIKTVIEKETFDISNGLPHILINLK